MSTNAEREDYTADLVPLAARLIGAVHDEGHNAIGAALDAMRRLPAPAGIRPDDAIAVTLAAMCDPARSPRTALRWTEQLTGGLTAVHPGPMSRMNALAVEMGISGRLPARAMATDELARVVSTLVDRGWQQDAIAEHLDTEARDIRQHVNTARKRNRRETPAA